MNVARFICAVLYLQLLTSVLSAGQPAPASGNSAVIILRPAMAFSDYKTDAALSPDGYGGAVYADRLQKEAVDQVHKLRIEVVHQETISEPAAREAAGLLQADSSRLARGLLSPETPDLLGRVTATSAVGEVLLLVQNMKVKLGDHGVWTPVYGFYGPSMTSTLVQAALITCRTDRVLWQGQGFRRDLPGVNSTKFGDLMKELYKGLTTTPR